MTFAFVFPGQGSQSVGMLADYASHPAVRATIDEASGVLGQDLWALIEDGPADALNQTVNTQPVMLAAGVAVLAGVGGRRGCRAGAGRRPQPGRVLGAGRRRRAQLPRRAAAGALSGAGDAGGGAGGRGRHGGGAGARRRRRGRRLRRRRAGTERRARQLQRAQPGRHRRPPGGGRARGAPPPRPAAPSARCCCRCPRRSTARC